MVRNSVLLFSVFLFSAFLGCAYSDVADTSATFNLVLSLDYQRLYNMQARLGRYLEEFKNRIRGIYASLTNRIQIIARNHGPVRTDSKVMEYMGPFKSSVQDFVAGLNSKLGEYFSALSLDVNRKQAIYTQAEGYLYRYIRKSIYETLTTCYPTNNANYTTSVLKAQVLSDSCYAKYESSLVKSYTAGSAKLAEAETTFNSFGIKLYPCISATLTDAQSVTCVHDVLDNAPDFLESLSIIYEAMSVYSLDEFEACINDNYNNKYPSLYKGAFESYAICVYGSWTYSS